MKIGIGLPNFGIMGTRENVLAIARESEKLGYDSLWVGERLLFPTQPKNLQGGRAWPESYQYSLDPLGTLALAAGATERFAWGRVS